MERSQSHHGRRGRGRGRERGNYSSSKPTSFKNTPINNKQDTNEADSPPNVVGTCPFMCPIDERIQRERVRDLAIFERLDGNPSKSSSTLAVKKFCRTISTTNPQHTDLRPLPVLQTTLNHLLTIFESPLHPFEPVHDFIFDRTRSIRQDLTMQNITSDHQAVNLYEQIVSFHIISHHKLQKTINASPMRFLNLEQLTKALSSLYHLYKANPNSNHEAEFYSFYILIHLTPDHQPPGELLSLFLRSLPCSVLKSKEMTFARSLLRHLRFGNYKCFLQTTEAEASRLQYYIIEPYICEVRALGLACVNYGGYKLSPYPLSDLSKHLFLEEPDVEAFIRDCGLDSFASDSGAKFMPTKQTSFCYPNKGSQKYYPLVSDRLKVFYDEV